MSLLPRKYYNYFFPRYINKAKRIATVSEFSKNDISSRFNIKKSTIDVVYNGANEDYKPLSQEIINTTRDKYSRGLPYFLFISLVHPRKNLTRIILAYNEFRKNSDTYIPLLIVGSTKYWTEDTKNSYEDSQFKEDIIFLGRLSNYDLSLVLGSSLALVYASLFEGFGIPIIEAMQCRVPVITSTTSSMPEVGGDAVCYVDPYSTDSISAAMTKLASDSSYRSLLISKGEIQAGLFTWQKTADRLWNSVIKATETKK